MKQKYFISILIAVPFLLLLGCRKGENDPFLSLKTRTSRLVGTWECKSMTYIYSSDEETKEIVFDGDSYVTTEAVEWGGATEETETIQTASITYSFTKDGAYTKELLLEEDGSERKSVIETTETGAWYWAGKNEMLGIANKEAIILTPTKIETSEELTAGDFTTTDNVTVTYSGADCPVYKWMLDKLSGDEMIIKMDGSYSEDDGSGITDEDYTSTTEATYEKE
ncbi:MAG: hypothetical protein C0594_10955 [Marinilabiliales bacterium]|nr:MAG: hypothetical protein C0594_10955 [Marinilabiliales bacterium]